MSAAHATIDLDDVEGLTGADRLGLLRAASMAGAQMRATAAALDEGRLDSLRSTRPPRSVIWMASGGSAAAAGATLAAALGGSTAAPMVVASEVPPWIGALDVMIVAGDDAGDPALVAAAASGIRRGARVVVAAPDEGPLREVAAGRSVVLAPRLLQVSDEFGFIRYLAAGLATLHVVDPGMSVDLAALADELDAEALCNSAGRELFTNPAKSIAERMSGRNVVLAGGDAASSALARHVGAVLLRIGHQPTAAVALSDALVALRSGIGSGTSDYRPSIFHDDEIDGPLPARVRTIVLATEELRQTIAATLSGYDDVDVISANDVPEAMTPRPSGRPEQQLAILALRLEMTAVYVRLARG